MYIYSDIQKMILDELVVTQGIKETCCNESSKSSSIKSCNQHTGNFHNSIQYSITLNSKCHLRNFT